MVRPNSKLRKGTKSDGLAKDTSDQVETFRGSSETESFIGSTTSPTITRIAKDMEQKTKRLKENQSKMTTTLKNMEGLTKALNKSFEKLRESLK